MFSGIVQEIGIVQKLESKNGILELTISSSKFQDLEIGSSIAVNGCCQTVVKVASPESRITFVVQATDETVKKTNFSFFKPNSKVNLECSLKINEKLDGHLVLGHIDTTGTVIELRSFGENTVVKISFPGEYRKYIAPKGSIAVNGVSLTVVDVEKDNFSFTLIPFTRDNTNLGMMVSGDAVNLEIDLISRYLINYLENSKELIKQ